MIARIDNPIFAWRTKSCLTQKEFANLFNETAKKIGIDKKWDRSTVSRKENFIIKISPEEAKVLEKITGLPRDWFLYPNDYKKQIISLFK